MKKIFKISLAIIIVSLFIGISFVKADYAVLVDTVNTYDVNDSSWDIVNGPNSSSGTGFEFEDTHFAEGTQVTVNVSAATASHIDYTVDVGAKSDTCATSSFDSIDIIFILFYPVLFSSGYSETWNQTKTDLGPSLIDLFFVDPTAASEFFYIFANTTYISSVVSDTEWTCDEAGGTFEIDNDIAIFDWVFNAQYVNTTANTDFSGTYSFTFAYNQTSGEVMGYKIDLDYSGTTEGSLLEIYLLQEIEMLGYDLPSETITSEIITTTTSPSIVTGFKWLIAIPALTIVGSLVAVIRKRRQ